MRAGFVSEEVAVVEEVATTLERRLLGPVEEIEVIDARRCNLLLEEEGVVRIEGEEMDEVSVLGVCASYPPGRSLFRRGVPIADSWLELRLVVFWTSEDLFRGSRCLNGGWID